MDGTIIDLASKTLQCLLGSPNVTWDDIRVYVLSLIVSAVVAVAVYVCQWKKKKSPLRQLLKSSTLDIAALLAAGVLGAVIIGYEHFAWKSVKSVTKNSASGNQSPAIQGRDVTMNYNNVSPEVLADVRKLAVTESALASFFRILEEQQVARGELDARLREIAIRHVELLQRFEAVTSDDPQVKNLKKQAGRKNC